MKTFFKFLITIFCFLITTNFVYASDTMTVKLRKNFQIKLESNPSTGYSWDLSKTVDKSYVKLVKNSYKQNRCNPRMVGVGGVETFVFKPLKKGSTTIYFEYKRPWEKENVVETKTVNIFIK